MSTKGKIITAKVQKVSPHPQANKLKICDVFDGSQIHTVVCGATNVSEGMISILATVDSTTPKGIVIKEAALRGISSHGMLCSPADLNISEERGIIDLPQDTLLGVEWNKVGVRDLSSKPWYKYKLCEVFYLTQDKKHTEVLRDISQVKKIESSQIVSMTYFHQGQYFYRNFL